MPQLARSETNSHFRLVEVTEQSGVLANYASGHEAGHHTLLQWLGGGVAVLDFDNDSQLDLVFAGGGKLDDKRITGIEPSLYRNLGSLQFDDVTASAAMSIVGTYTHGCHAADFNNDGFVDVLITGYEHLQLFQNQGDGTFRDVTQDCSLDDTLWSTSAAWGDFNGDASLDLYICHYLDWSFDNHPTCRTSKDGPIDACAPKRFQALPDCIYYSNGDGTFRDATSEAGLVTGGKGLGVVAADLDVDGDLDIYVANDTTANFLYLNEGGVFEELGVLNGVSGDQFGQFNGSMGVDVGDYNSDGLIDLWATNYIEEPFALYKNLGKGIFQHVSNSTGINALGSIYVGFGTGFVDIDGDQDDDLIVSNGHVLQFPPSEPVSQHPIILENIEKRRFQPIDAGSHGGYLGRPHIGRSVAWGDLDRDSDLDFIITHINERASLLRNDSQPKPEWISIRVVGTTSDRDAIGCSAELRDKSGVQLRINRGGGSYLSQSSSELSWSTGGLPHFEVDRAILRITWPSGRTAEFTNLVKGQNYVAIEPQTADSEATLTSINCKVSSRSSATR